MKNLVLPLLFLLCTLSAAAQTLRGTVQDEKTKESLIGATVAIKGTSNGTSTNLDGQFVLENVKSLPVTLVISYVGYTAKEQQVKEFGKEITVLLGSNEKVLKEVSVVESRLTEKQRESALTVEAMDILAIKQTPSVNFYDGLGLLKGVDVTAASLGFKIVNTRGFNSTSPVRSLQIIDGVDNQAPGLNFSLGNFLGSSELDVLKVDLIVGASSAFYGPNAFNGVISMTTRSPFVKPGLEISYKTGSRNLSETALRYAFVLKNKEGQDKLGMKFNMSYFKAYDWEADNRSATPQSRSNEQNPGGYDAVNVYGDEYNPDLDRSLLPAGFPGIGVVHRTGYAEKDLVDYNTRNLKLNSAVHYKLDDSTEFIASSSFGTGTTIYQGDNRYSLRDILFFQNRLELRKQDKFFLRTYVTNEDAGNSYDAFFTALLLQNSVKDDQDWLRDYLKYFSDNQLFQKIKKYPGYPEASQYSEYTQYIASIQPFLLQNYYDSLVKFHNAAEIFANGVGNPIFGNQAFLQPGTAAFDSAFRSITSRETFAGGGSRFYDKSALQHVHGEYKFSIGKQLFTAGANYRRYLPNSRGTIFSDTSGIRIRNSEFGIYAGADRSLADNKVKLNATIRLDKNVNFKALVSPALSCVYSPDSKNTFRISLSSAIRNPTLADQYLYYQVGRAVLIGNLNGFDSLVTISSFVNALNYQNKDTLEYFSVAAVQPEKVRTIEGGYRGTLFEKLLVDASAYFSTYRDFIGYKIGADVTVYPSVATPQFNNIYRVAANSEETVNTAGFTIGANYFFSRFYSFNANYSYNELIQVGGWRHFPFLDTKSFARSETSLIPAFNTPKRKFNIGISGMDIDNRLGSNWGFNINYKWVEGFLFEGSPQFTGQIDNYGLLDAQVNKRFPAAKSTIKLGCSNLLENLHYEVYGGPLIGRLFYLQLLVELN